MNRGVVLEFIDERTAVVLTSDMRFLRIPRGPGMVVGAEVSVPAAVDRLAVAGSPGGFRRRIFRQGRARWLPAAGAVAASVLVALGFTFGRSQFADAAPYAYVSVDVNPGVEFRIDRAQRVTGALALDAQGRVVLQDVHPQGMRIDRAVKAYLQAATRAGYVAGKTSVIVTMSPGARSEAPANLRAVLNGIDRAVRGTLGARAGNIASLIVEKKVLQTALAYHVTPGRLALYVEAVRAHKKVSWKDIVEGHLARAVGGSQSLAQLTQELNRDPALETILQKVAQNAKIRRPVKLRRVFSREGLSEKGKKTGHSEGPSKTGKSHSGGLPDSGAASGVPGGVGRTGSAGGSVSITTGQTNSGTHGGDGSLDSGRGGLQGGSGEGNSDQGTSGQGTPEQGAESGNAAGDALTPPPALPQLPPLSSDSSGGERGDSGNRHKGHSGNGSRHKDRGQEAKGDSGKFKRDKLDSNKEKGSFSSDSPPGLSGSGIGTPASGDGGPSQDGGKFPKLFQHPVNPAHKKGRDVSKRRGGHKDGSSAGTGIFGKDGAEEGQPGGNGGGGDLSAGSGGAAGSGDSGSGPSTAFPSPPPPGTYPGLPGFSAHNDHKGKHRHPRHGHQKGGDRQGQKGGQDRHSGLHKGEKQGQGKDRGGQEQRKKHKGNLSLKADVTNGSDSAAGSAGILATGSEGSAGGQATGDGSGGGDNTGK